MAAQPESRASLSGSQAQAGDPVDEFRSQDCDLSMALRWLRRAIADTGWNSTALAHPSVMDRDRSYIDRVLDGEKPCSLVFILALPKDVQRRFAEIYAEHWGLLVVRPVSEDIAIANLVSGLIGLLAPRAEKKRMARAEMRERVKEKVG